MFLIQDYDDVDRILLARPHYIRDKEISVTKFIPSDYHDHSSSNQRSRHSNRTDRLIITTSNHRTTTPTDDEEDEEEEEEEEGECDETTDQYEQIKEKFEKYKQEKELELFSLKLDLERTKKQLADLTQEKLDLLLKNQQTYHKEILLRLCPIDSIERPTKKRKLSTSSIHCEYDYYS